jgi:hypothetical protein
MKGDILVLVERFQREVEPPAVWEEILQEGERKE